MINIVKSLIVSLHFCMSKIFYKIIFQKNIFTKCKLTLYTLLQSALHQLDSMFFYCKGGLQNFTLNPSTWC